MSENLRYILVNGYGWTGSSIVIDLLKEYNNVFAPKHEFRIIKDPHGLADLDYVLNSKIDQLNVDFAIKEFIKMVTVYARKGGYFKPLGGELEKEFGKEIYAYTEEFINELSDFSFKGYWHFLSFYDSAFKLFVKRLLRKIKKDTLYEDMRISIADEERFIEAAKRYINRLFEVVIKDKKDIDMIVLDQPIHPMKLSMAGRYFDDYRVVVVDRDPRDVYANLIKRKTLVGYDTSISHDPTLFIMWFKSQHSSLKEDENVLRLYFEDIVLHADVVTEQIMHYCELSETNHVEMGRFFNPEKSKNNIKIYDKFASKEEIRMIENELGEYLYEN